MSSEVIPNFGKAAHFPNSMLVPEFGNAVSLRTEPHLLSVCDGEAQKKAATQQSVVCLS
jgi:hypothetical protein